MYDYYRTAAAVPDIKVCDVEYNTNQIINMLNEAMASNVKLITFPELSLTGYTCADLFLQDIS